MAIRPIDAALVAAVDSVKDLIIIPESGELTWLLSDQFTLVDGESIITDVLDGKYTLSVTFSSPTNTSYDYSLSQVTVNPDGSYTDPYKVDVRLSPPHVDYRGKENDLSAMIDMIAVISDVYDHYERVRRDSEAMDRRSQMRLVKV